MTAPKKKAASAKAKTGAKAKKAEAEAASSPTILVTGAIIAALLGRVFAFIMTAAMRHTTYESMIAMMLFAVGLALINDFFFYLWQKQLRQEGHEGCAISLCLVIGTDAAGLFIFAIEAAQGSF